MPSKIERIEKLFDSDGSEIRNQFILAGLLLAVFERLKNYVVLQVDAFFADSLELQDSRLHAVRGEKFIKLVKEKGAGKIGQHRNKDFRAALHWFYDSNAIDKNEVDAIEALYLRRNEIGHELLEILVGTEKEQINLSDVLFTFGIYVKIVRWWFKEIEAATDPDLDQAEYDAIAWDEVETGETIFLRQVIHQALQGNPEWELFKKEFGDSASTQTG